MVFSKEDKIELRNLFKATKAKDTLSIWQIYSVWANVLPIVLSILLSYLTNMEFDFFRIVNNGSISLISYSIIISAIFYLLDKTKPDHEMLRKKILGHAIILLFINISVYIVLNIFNDKLQNCAQIVLFISSLFFFLYTVYITKRMVVLQSSIVNGYQRSIVAARDRVRDRPISNEDDETEY